MGSSIRRALGLALVCLVTLGACTGAGRGNSARREPLTREKILRVAERYRTHNWTADAHNVFHGTDRDGIRVDTPDISFRPGSKRPGSKRPGWWIPGQVNKGLPYQWGGFDTPEEFDEKIARGFYAGDVATKEKRRLLESGVSRKAAGIDCSGFISQCLGLKRAYSTRELHLLCDEVTDWEALQPGDLFLKYNDHVSLFCGYVDGDKSKLAVYETGSPPTWKVTRQWYPAERLRGWGFRAMRYREIAPDPK